MIWTLWNYNDPEPLILSASEAEEVSISELAGLISCAIGHPGPINFDTSRADGQHRKTACTAQLQSLPHGITLTPLTEGLQQTAAWILENYPNIRL